MLRTHDYEFAPGKRVFKKDSIVTTEGTVALSREIIISAARGSGWLFVREIIPGGDKASETGPGEFRLPYTQGTYTLTLPFRWPFNTAFEVVNAPDDPTNAGCVRVVLVRSQAPEKPRENRLYISSDGESIDISNVGSASTFPTGRVLIKNSSESDEPFAYSFSPAPAFNALPKLYPGEALPEFEVRRALTVYAITAGVVGANTYAEWVEVPT